ncbi:MAG TPA: hypothetical protein VGL24_08340 [Chthoniobacterales bacterium]
MTLEEIIAREDQLLDQIAESKRLLATYQLLRAERETLPFPDRPAVAATGGVIESHPETAPPSVPPPAAVHVLPAPNLAELSKGYGGRIRLVTWAIRQMTGDFTVRDIASVTQQAGFRMRVAKVSVVLNRMKDERKVEELKKGRGRTPSLFRATARVTTGALELAARHCATRLHRRYRLSR